MKKELIISMLFGFALTSCNLKLSNGETIHRNDKVDSVLLTQELIKYSKVKISTIENFDIWRIDSINIIFFKAKMAIDADGSPRAYCPNNNGLDYIENAGHKGNWWGVVVDKDSNPIKQKDSDPCPGCYISTTTLIDKNYSDTNPLKYTNSEKIPFIALPNDILNLVKIKIGDFVLVVNTINNKRCFAILADLGPKNKLGEGSIFLAEKLNINSNPKNGGVNQGIIYIIFPNSGLGNGKIPTVDEINNMANKEFEKTGGEQTFRYINN